jgi:uncharacterized membrane-anchored protein YhcB (DUF1043 family)
MSNGYDLSWAWGIGIIGFAIGIGCGLAIGLLLRGNRRREEELEQEVTAQQRQFDAYRVQVNQHFQTTSELVQKMTDSYRDVYTHLAAGSAALCKDEVAAPSLEFADQPVLDNPAQDVAPDRAAAEDPADTEAAPSREIDDDRENDTVIGDSPHVPRLDSEAPPTPRTPPT